MPVCCRHFDQFLCHRRGQETPESLIVALSFAEGVGPIACDPTLGIDFDIKHPAESGDSDDNVVKPSLSCETHILEG